MSELTQTRFTWTYKATRQVLRSLKLPEYFTIQEEGKERHVCGQVAYSVMRIIDDHTTLAQGNGKGWCTITVATYIAEYGPKAPAERQIRRAIQALDQAGLIIRQGYRHNGRRRQRIRINWDQCIDRDWTRLEESTRRELWEELKSDFHDGQPSNPIGPGATVAPHPIGPERDPIGPERDPIGPVGRAAEDQPRPMKTTTEDSQGPDPVVVVEIERLLASASVSRAAECAREFARLGRSVDLVRHVVTRFADDTDRRKTPGRVVASIRGMNWYADDFETPDQAEARIGRMAAGRHAADHARLRSVFEVTNFNHRYGPKLGPAGVRLFLARIAKRELGRDAIRRHAGLIREFAISKTEELTNVT